MALRQSFQSILGSFKLPSKRDFSMYLWNINKLKSDLLAGKVTERETLFIHAILFILLELFMFLYWLGILEVFPTV